MPEITVLETAWQAKARALLDDFAVKTKPALHKIKIQTIHGDLHPFNALLGTDEKISGLIYFGDMIHAPLVVDPANTIADCLQQSSDVEYIFATLNDAAIDAKVVTRLIRSGDTSRLFNPG